MDHLISACNETLCWEYSSHDLSHFGWFNVKLWAWLINRGHPNRGGLLLKRIPNKQNQGWCLVCASWTLGHWYVCTGEQSGTPPCHQIKLNPRNITNFYFAFFVIMMLQWVPKSLPVIPTSAVFFVFMIFTFTFMELELEGWMSKKRVSFLLGSLGPSPKVALMVRTSQKESRLQKIRQKQAQQALRHPPKDPLNPLFNRFDTHHHTNFQSWAYQVFFLKNCIMIRNNGLETKGGQKWFLRWFSPWFGGDILYVKVFLELSFNDQKCCSRCFDLRIFMFCRLSVFVTKASQYHDDMGGGLF